MIFSFLLTIGFPLLLLLTKVSTDVSKNESTAKAFSYYKPLENEIFCEDMEDEECQAWINSMSYNDGKGSSVPLFPDDQTQCEIVDAIRCDPSSPYQRINGSCNNLAHTTWGMAQGCYLRFQPAFYDGTDNIRKSVTGNPLPESREISINIFRDVRRESSKFSFMFTLYGQILAHDLSRDDILELDMNCCSPEFINNPACISLPARPNDPYFSQYNKTCLFMHRTRKCLPCNTTSRQQVNAATAPLDVSTIYGPDDRKSAKLRAKDGTGKLRSNLTENGEIFTFDHDAHKLFCPLRKNCFFTGDVRVNQHVLLTSMETLLMREHNRIATKLKKLNPHWEEEKLFQESRRIVSATMQCITFKEYLPMLLGLYAMKKFDLVVRNTSDGTKYNPNIKIGIRNEFATAAFRIHSMVPTEIGSFDLKFRNTYQYPEPIIDGHLGKLLKGASITPSEKNDRYFVVDTTKYFAMYREIPIGTDLAAVDIQRGREHGLAPYVVMVKFCSEGQINIKSFGDLAPLLMSKKRAALLKENYESVEDVDLYVGIHLEHKFPGSIVGPTALCIITQQFYFAKFGDRFYFEHEGEVSSFTKDQRSSIKQCSLTRILCDNSNITHLHKSPMHLPSSKNPEVPCEEIPRIDLNYWKETP